jgi:hypothetical protein
MGKERTMTRALQRGAVDNFVVKKRWVKGKGGGSVGAQHHATGGEGGPGGRQGCTNSGGWQR